MSEATDWLFKEGDKLFGFVSATLDSGQILVAGDGGVKKFDADKVGSVNPGKKLYFDNEGNPIKVEAKKNVPRTTKGTPSPTRGSLRHSNKPFYG